MSVISKNDMIILPQSFPEVLNQLIITYLRYADYSDEEIRKFFPISTVMVWRKSAIMFGMINHVLHSIDDQPIMNGNVQIWYRDGNIHRDNASGDITGLLRDQCFTDLPAYIDGNNQIWYKHGKIHRENDLPAIDGYYQAWYMNGELHRDGDKPAYINGIYQGWYMNGELHRDGDKPAYINGTYQGWYMNGVSIRHIILVQ